MEIEIYDSLRDGSQDPLLDLKAYEKLRIAEALGKLAGESVIFEELGWPNSKPGGNQEDIKVYELLPLYDLGNVVPTVFGQTRKVGIKAEEDETIKGLIATRQSGVPIATIFGKANPRHVQNQLQTTLEDNLSIVEDSISTLKRAGMRVFFDAEHFFDGFKSNPEYALRVIETAANAGAERIVLCDTNGGTISFQFREVLAAVKRYLHENSIDVPIGVHTHNDGHLSVANSLEAIFSYGVPHVQGCMIPVGERTSNADLASIIAWLYFGHKQPEIASALTKHGLSIPRFNYSVLRELSDFIHTAVRLEPDPRKPFVGINARKHTGGVHQDGENKDPGLYTAFKLEEIGNDSDQIVWGLQSGTAHIAKVAGQVLGYSVNKRDPRIKAILEEVKRMSSAGYQIGFLGAEQELLIRSHFGWKPPFHITRCRTRTESDDANSKSAASLELQVNGYTAVSNKFLRGNGPVDAMYLALLEGLSKMHKDARDISVQGFNVSIARDEGAASSVRVYFELGTPAMRWGCVGVSTNIMEAAKEALEKGINYYFLKNSNL